MAKRGQRHSRRGPAWDGRNARAIYGGSKARGNLQDSTAPRVRAAGNKALRAIMAVIGALLLGAANLAWYTLLKNAAEEDSPRSGKGMGRDWAGIGSRLWAIVSQPQ